jgi:hypothetical protein
VRRYARPHSIAGADFVILVAYAFRLMYIVDKFFVVPITTHNRPTVACLLLFGMLPALGYVSLGRTRIRNS